MSFSWASSKRLFSILSNSISQINRPSIILRTSFLSKEKTPSKVFEVLEPFKVSDSPPFCCKEHQEGRYIPYKEESPQLLCWLDHWKPQWWVYIRTYQRCLSWWGRNDEIVRLCKSKVASSLTIISLVCLLWHSRNLWYLSSFFWNSNSSSGSTLSDKYKRSGSTLIHPLSAIRRSSQQGYM